MENKPKMVALIKSPSRKTHLRKAEGFSLKEIKEAGKTIDLLKIANIKIDYFRKSVYPENIEILKTIEFPKKKGKKRAPFVKKEKKKTPFKPKIEKPKVKKVVKPKVPPKKPVVKEKPKPVKKEKPIKKEIGIVKPKGTPLTNLSGLGLATAKKFIELGVSNIEELVKENPDELGPLIKGVTLERLIRWIDEGKELLK